jgi:predicted permease
MAANRRRREDLTTRTFRALLALYPAAFRDEYDRELMLVFVDRYRRASGRWDRIRLWLDALGGVLAEAPKEHARMIVQDLRYALRVLRQRPLVTATIVLTLSVGMGANTAMFSLLNSIVLRTLPVPTPEQLYVLRASPPLAPANRFSGPMVERLRSGMPQDAGLLAMGRVARVYARTEREPDAVRAALQLVSADYFRVLGVPLSMGGLAESQGGSQTAARSVVISYAYWQRRFGGTPDVLGRALIINGETFTIGGVGPEGFGGVWLESPVDIWAPLSAQREVKYTQNYTMDGADPKLPWVVQERVWWLDVIVRAPPGRTAAIAGALNGIARGVAPKASPLTLEPYSNGSSGLRQRFSTPLYALIGMAALVMLIACANVANLLLARAAERQREVAVRMSLGAGRGRLLHQLLTEGILLVSLSGLAALLIARWAADAIVRTATAAADGPAPFAAEMDVRVLAFTALVAFASVLLFALAPAWRATRVDLVTALNAGGRTAAGSTSTKPARALVVLQVALSLVLATGTGLLVRGLQNLLQLDLGFEPAHLLSVAIDPRLSPDALRNGPELYHRLLETVSRVQGVQSASLAMCGLQTGCRAREDVVVQGYRPRTDEQVLFTINVVSTDYFSTTGMRLVAGRAFNDRDLQGGPRVAIVNRVVARSYFADGQALGRHFGEREPDVEIVGIVDDARLQNVQEPPSPSAFFPLSQVPIAPRQLDVRTQGQPRASAGAVRAAIRRIAPDLPIESIVTMDERIRLGLSQERLVVSLTSGFAVMALGLAGFGLFGLLSYVVARRTSEFGLRMALGASRSSVLWSVVKEALLLVLLGCAVGLPAVYASGGLVSKLFVGVSPRDWSIFTAMAALLIGVACGCSALPAFRASRVDPMVALRDE